MDSEAKAQSSKFFLLLSEGTKPVVSECVSTENVSSNGVRVRTVRLDCIVKHAEPVRGIGVEFKDVPDMEREQLELLVAGLAGK
jgi:hypothetical protein